MSRLLRNRNRKYFPLQQCLLGKSRESLLMKILVINMQRSPVGIRTSLKTTQATSSSITSNAVHICHCMARASRVSEGYCDVVRK